MRLRNQNIRKIIGSILILFLVFAMISVFSSMRKNNKLVSNSSNKDSLAEDELIQQNCEHTYSSWQVKTEATCTEKGEKIRTCSICNYVEISSISKLAHNYEENYRVEPTCTEQGQIGYLCTMCNESYFVSIDPAHTPQVKQAAKEPTCTTYGNTAGISCSVCGAIIQVSVPISPIGHTYVDVITANTATCTEEGTKTISVTCSACGYVDSSFDEPSSPLGHTASSNWTYCDDLMYRKYCEVCGEILEETNGFDITLTIKKGTFNFNTLAFPYATIHEDSQSFFDDMTMNEDSVVYTGFIDSSISPIIKLQAEQSSSGYVELFVVSMIDGVAVNAEYSFIDMGNGLYHLILSNFNGPVEVVISGKESY